MGKQKQNRFFNMKASADGKSADIFIYGEITKYAWEEYGEVSSITFKNELDQLGNDVETINLYINSPGGSVFETKAIIAMLQRHQARIISHIDGLAASCASVLPMISDEIRMPSNAMMMVHNAWTYASGNSEQLRKAADDLERINQSMIQYYLDRAGDKLNPETLKELLDAETWLSADQAFQYGLCDVVLEANNTAASISDKYLSTYKNVPEQILNTINLRNNQTISEQEMAERQRIAEEAKAGSDYINIILGGLV